MIRAADEQRVLADGKAFIRGSAPNLVSEERAFVAYPNREG